MIAVTKYKYIQFKPIDTNWKIVNHKYNETIGYLEYNVKWKEWELLPNEDTGWTLECLQDVIHFIKQLKEMIQ